MCPKYADNRGNFARFILLRMCLFLRWLSAIHLTEILCIPGIFVSIFHTSKNFKKQSEGSSKFHFKDAKVNDMVAI